MIKLLKHLAENLGKEDLYNLDMWEEYEKNNLSLDTKLKTLFPKKRLLDKSSNLTESFIES